MTTKRKVFALLVMLFAGVGAMAQAVPDSTTTDGNNDGTEINAQVNRDGKKREANVLGAPIYYDTLGRRLGSDEEEFLTSDDYFYRRPKHHYLNNLHDDFDSFFCEVELLLSRNPNVGLNLAFVPERWGGYVSLLRGERLRDDYVSFGPVLRLSGYDSMLDWQLYGGLMLGSRHLGCEAGLRVAAPHSGHSHFCWTSCSMGMGIINGDVFVTLGASLDVAACSLLFLLL